VIIAFALAPALIELHPVGAYHAPYADEAVAASLTERHATNVAGTIAYDIRGVDTLGEELMLFAAVIGMALLLRTHTERHREEHGVDRAEAVSRAPGTSRPGVRRAAACVLALSMVFGWYMVLHATQTPGGGFQGGAILASAFTLIYLGFGYRVWANAVHEERLDVGEGIGVGGLVITAAIPIALGATLLWNWLPYGTLGKLASGGTMFVINIAIGIAVAAGFVAIVSSVLFDLHESLEAVETGDS
jgi:multicomponent Na+:H+ antiporter subunit B